MSSPKVRNQSVEGIAKPAEKETTEKCGVGRVSRLPTHARSPSVPGQKSKIPTNIGHPGRPGMQSQVNDNSRLLTSVASDETALDKGSPINSGRRPTSRSATNAPANLPAATNVVKAKASTTPSGHSSMLRRHCESQFATKRKRYTALKKELMDKQKSASELYEEMTQLRDKLIASGAKDPGKIETINLTGIPSETCAAHQFTVDSHAFRGSGEQVFAPNSAVTGERVSSLEAQLRQMSNRCFDLCGELLQKRAEIVQRLAEFDGKNGEASIDSEIARQVEIYRAESADLETRLEERKKADEETVTETIQKISALWNEVEVSRARIGELERATEETTKELRAKVDEALREKKIETEKCEQLQERKQVLENELQKLKTRIRAMETRTNEDETKITQLQSTVKSLESQLRQKETGAEQRLKEMQKSLKHSESLLAKTEKQRDNFESRLNELKKNLSSKEIEAENRIKELSEKLAAAGAKLMENDKKTDEGVLSSGGMTMGSAWVVESEQKIASLQREKEDIVRVIYHGLLSEESDFRLDDQSISHETLVSALMKKMQDIRINFKLTQDANDNLEKQLLELRSRVQSQSKDNGSGSTSFWSNQVNELRQQVCDLRCSVAELTRRNETLEIQLNQKQLEVEKQERTIREQVSILKVRDEVIRFFKEKSSARTSGEAEHLLSTKKKNLRDREQVDLKIIEKTENLQQLYSTLETKQMQISRLEQLVKDMEIQQDRAQEQRTRMERKIAQLQVAMHRGKSHRYVTIESPPSTAKASSTPVCDPPHDQPTPQHPGTTTDIKNNNHCRPQSHSRPPPSRSPPRRPQIQRSKTLNSIPIKPRATSSREYTTKVIDEVVRTLKRERAYDYQKRALRGERRHSRDDCGAAYIDDDDVLDVPSILKDEFQESLYNWLVEPWMLEGETTNLLQPPGPLCQNHSPKVYTTSSEISVNVARKGQTPRRLRGPNDCSRESRCGSPGCRRRSSHDWDCSPSPVRARTSPQENTASRSRRQKS